MNKIAWAVSGGVFAFTLGCASPPGVPSDFNPRNATIIAVETAPTLVLDGPGSKGSAAAKGAATWGGVGFVVGGLLCMGTGPLAALCLGTMVPAGLGVGAAGGAMVAAVKAEGADESGAKRALLEVEMAAWAARRPLASLVQARTAVAGADALANPPASASATPPVWQLKIALTELATLGSGSGVPYALKASATLDMQRAGQAQQAQPPFVKHYQASTTTRMTTADWAAADSQAMRATLDLMTQDLATQIVKDLVPAKPGD